MGRAAKLKAARKQMRKDPEFQKAVRKERNKIINGSMNLICNNFLRDNASIACLVLHDKFKFGAGRMETFLQGWAEVVTHYNTEYEQSTDDTAGFAMDVVKHNTGFDVGGWLDAHGFTGD